MEYCICKRCVMDNASDSTIIFDKNGYCDYCTDALQRAAAVYFPNSEGEKKLELMIADLKEKGKNKSYDCLMGISGGLDSSYLAYLGAIQWGLRILAVHVDDGFDTPLAVSNIEKLCKSCGINLIIERPDSEQFCDLTKSFILAEVPNIAIPQDNVLFASLYKYAKQYQVYTFLSGGNFALESILQRGHTYMVYDMIHNKNIHNVFGTKPVDNLQFLSIYQRYWDLYIHKIKRLRPLNYLNYNRDNAIKQLSDFCGYEYYEAKHLENYLTKVAQLYWFYNKFKVDKRRSHLSSMIVSGQMTRDEAITLLEKPIYDEVSIQDDLKLVLNKLDLDMNVFEEIVRRPGREHSYYKQDRLIPILLRLKKMLSF